LVPIATHSLSQAKLVFEDSSLFDRNWSLYKRLVDLNLFHHQEVSQSLRSILQTRYASGFTFLDLACGDAQAICETLKGLPVIRYCGVDLSLPALDLAQKNLSDAAFPVTLEHGDIMDALPSHRGWADVVWCGLSVHHFRLDDKLRLLNRAHRALKPGGVLMIYEPVRGDFETPVQFHTRMEPVLRAEWASLSDAEFDELWQHITTSDIPESSETWLKLGLKAGFKSARTIFSQPGTGYCRLFRYDEGSFRVR